MLTFFSWRKVYRGEKHRVSKKNKPLPQKTSSPSPLLSDQHRLHRTLSLLETVPIPLCLSPYLCTNNKIPQNWSWLGVTGFSSRFYLLSYGVCPVVCPACTCVPDPLDRYNHQPWVLQREDKINNSPNLPVKLGPSHHEQITCFRIADLTGLFKEMSGCQWVLHKQSCVWHHRFRLRHQQLYYFGYCCVTWPTVVGLRRDQK